MLPWTWVYKYLFSHCFQSFLLSLHWVLIAAFGLFVVVCGLSLVAVWWLLLLWHMDSPVVAHRLSCSEASGTLVPWPRIEPMSSALEGGFLTTGPLGKFLLSVFWAHNQQWNHWIKWQLFVQLFDERPCSFPRWLYHFAFSPAVHKSFHFYTALQILLVFCFLFFFHNHSKG